LIGKEIKGIAGRDKGISLPVFLVKGIWFSR